MRINENNYVDKAEEAIIELVKDAKERYGVRYRDKLVTTSKIRNLLAMTADSVGSGLQTIENSN